MKIWLAALVLVVAGAPGAERSSISVLSREVRHFSIGKTSVVDALLWLGHDERVSFGIELSGAELSRETQISVDMTTLSDIVKTILGPSNAYRISDSDGVILIRSKGVDSAAWLDHRLRLFDLGRLELMTANNGLWMKLESDLNPTVKGFLGDFPVTDPIDEVGPFHERDKTVRQLLIRIVALSRGASWFPSVPGVRISFPASVNRFWTLASTSGRSASRPQ